MWTLKNLVHLRDLRLIISWQFVQADEIKQWLRWNDYPRTNLQHWNRGSICSGGAIERRAGYSKQLRGLAYANCGRHLKHLSFCFSIATLATPSRYILTVLRETQCDIRNIYVCASRRAVSQVWQNATMQNRNNKLGTLIRNAREQVGMSQSRLSEELSRLGNLELGNTTIAKIENGTRGLAVTEAAAFSKALGIPWDAFNDLDKPIEEQDRLAGAVKVGSESLYEQANKTLSKISRLQDNIADLLNLAPDKYPPAKEISQLVEEIANHLLEVIRLETELRSRFFDTHPMTRDAVESIYKRPTLMDVIEQRKRQADGDR